MSTFNAGAIEARLTLDRTEFVNELKAARSQAQRFEKSGIDLKLTIDYEQAFYELEGKILEQEQNDINLAVAADTAEAEAELAMLRDLPENVTLDVNADTEQARLELDALRVAEEAAGNDVNINVDVNSAEAETKLGFMDGIVQSLDGKTANVNVDVDSAAADLHLAETQAMISLMDGETIHVNVDTDKSAWDSLVGPDGGGGSMGFFKVLIIAILALAPILAVAISALGAVLLAFGAIIFALAGGLALVLITMMLAYKQFVKAEKAGAPLTKGMQQLHDALKQLSDAWAKFQALTGDQVFGLLADAVTLLADILPKLAPIFKAFSDVIERMFKGIDGWVNSPSFVAFVRFFSRFGAKELEMWGQIFGNLFIGMMGLFKAVIPFALHLTKALVNLTEGWRKGSRHFGENPAFQNFIRTAVEYGPALLSMLGAFWGALVHIGEALVPFAGPMIEGLTIFFNLIGQIPTHDLTILIGLIGGLWAAFTFLVPLLPAIITGIELIGAVIGVLLSPVGLIVIALAAFGYALYQLWTGNKQFRDGVISSWENIRDTIMPVVAAIVQFVKDHWDSIMKWTMDTWKQIRQAVKFFIEDILIIITGVVDTIAFIWHRWGDIISKATVTYFTGIANIITGVFDIILGALKLFHDVFTGNWSGAWEDVKQIFHGFVTWIKGSLQIVAAFMILIFNTIGREVSKAWQKLWDWVKREAKAAWGWIVHEFHVGQQAISMIWQAIKGTTMNVWHSILAAIHTILSAIWSYIVGRVNAVKNAVSIAWHVIQGVTHTVWSAIKAFISGVWNGIRGLVSTAVNTVKNSVSSAWNAVKTATTTAWNAVKSTISNKIGEIVALVRGLPGKLRALAGMFKSAGQWLINAFVDGMKNAAGIIEGIASNVWNAVRTLLNGAISKLNAAFSFTISIPGPDIHVNLPDIPYLAEGGLVTRPTLAMIGEAGPEVVIPLSRLSHGRSNERSDSGLAVALNDSLRMLGAILHKQGADGAPFIGQYIDNGGRDIRATAEDFWLLSKARG